MNAVSGVREAKNKLFNRELPLRGRENRRPVLDRGVKTRWGWDVVGEPVAGGRER